LSRVLIWALLNAVGRCSKIVSYFLQGLELMQRAIPDARDQ